MSLNAQVGPVGVSESVAVHTNFSPVRAKRWRSSRHMFDKSAEIVQSASRPKRAGMRCTDIPVKCGHFGFAPNHRESACLVDMAHHTLGTERKGQMVIQKHRVRCMRAQACYEAAATLKLQCAAGPTSSGLFSHAASHTAFVHQCPCSRKPWLLACGSLPALAAFRVKGGRETQEKTCMRLHQYWIRPAMYWLRRPL